MIAYLETQNRYGEKELCALVDGVEIARITKTENMGKPQYCVGITWEREHSEFLGRAATIAGAKKLIRQWGEQHLTEVSQRTTGQDVKRLPQFSDTGFYPTPSNLAGRMLAGVRWKDVTAILEPSAGKGDLADAARKFVEDYHNDRKVCVDKREPYIDCVEIDPDLALILKGKGYPVVSDDFLTFHTFKQYDLILMNPPFENGDEHLLKALSLMERGGQIVCLLNAETIRNPYTNRRKVLRQKLSEYNAKIEFIENAFAHAQRKTNVEIAMIFVDIPYPKPESDIFEHLKRSREETYTAADGPTALASADWLQNMIDGFQFEAELGNKLIREYQGLRPYLMNGSTTYEKPLLELTCSEKGRGNDAGLPNVYLRALRGKYWRTLLSRPELTGKMTSAMRQDYQEKIETLSAYDFSRYNIETVMREIAHQLTQGVEESILNLFETFTAKHAWYPECANNIHYYNGWATNKAHKIGMKVIVPASGCYADSWRDEKLDTYRVNSMISDLERAMNYLDRGETYCHIPVDGAVRLANGVNSNKASFTYFDCVFYKKGTCHIKFKPNAVRIIDRLNIFAGQHKNWLPPVYGKKHYQDMTPEEQAVIDEFQGEAAYESVLSDPSMLISAGDIALAALPSPNP